MNETYRSLCRMRIAFAQSQIYLLEMDGDSVNPYYTMAKYIKLTDFGTIIAIVLFFAGLIYCGLTGIYLDSEKDKKHRVLRFSVIFAALVMIYCEYCAVNIGFTLNPPKNATFKCVEK